ncbi:methyltransferase domain-containing protein [Salinarchaeum sp. Harcht-Bsk1]|uniref:methyltransferase domain-containing protein n=1 Tax=Salinarchaeum sp. Harcht-Bsk1 TaxID=1333523 RepID=UPI0009DB8D7B|nr:methyltransferase domain-containing protein [Salinarchaeum sp. Harcht-Bsk1]
MDQMKDEKPNEAENVKVDLGGGKNPLDDHINVDLRKLPEVDIVATADDLPFADCTVDRIHANSLVPHIDNLNAAMDEWSRVLTEGGELELAATHANSTGIVADPDHYSWSWTSTTPGWYDIDSEWAYYSDTELQLEEVDVVGWLRPERWWIRPPSWLFGILIDWVSHEVADELIKLPFGGGRVRATWRKPK